jgi:gamma-D-glutamyl-L-lysine dipeptidyl-peptidase
VRASIAPLLAGPTAASIQTSQLLGGHLVDVLDEQGDWLQVVGADGYEGWVHAGYLGEPSSSGEGPVPCGWESDGRLSLGCTARTVHGAHLRLPLGALLPDDTDVETGEALTLAERRAQFPLAASSILDAADRFFPGTPYVWGGLTPWGADCSGFVQALFALHGLQLPRDAWQQSEVGRLVGKRSDTRAGDLAFFRAPNEPRATHVGLIVVPDAMIHLSVSRGGYAVEDFAGGDPLSVRLVANYKFARRVLPD